MRDAGALVWGAMIVVLMAAGLALWGIAGAVLALVVCGLAWGLFDRRRRAAS